MIQATDHGVVFNIQRFSLHDGQGIRTIVFLKGCPLKCRWCSNPESQNQFPELGLNPSLCLGPKACGRCIEACPHALISIKGGQLAWNRAGCVNCLKCAEACPAGARFIYGRQMNASDVMNSVESDGHFYRRSGGGLTLSGGEAAAQPGFALALLAEAKKRRLDAAMETAGHSPWEALAALAQNLDRIIYDLKHWSEERHRELTGVGLGTILSNLNKLAQEFPKKPITVRTPVIPGLNDTHDDLARIRSLIPEGPRVNWELLPYHRMGEAKYALLGRDYPWSGAAPEPERLEALKAGLASLEARA